MINQFEIDAQEAKPILSNLRLAFKTKSGGEQD